MHPVPEIYRDLILVGGGHAHVLALRMLAMQPIAGLRISLVSPASHTPYSGMLPGWVAGHYRFEQTHIDLVRLCQWANVRFVQAAVVAVDPDKQILRFGDRPSMSYDVLSIDIGSQPELDTVPGARAHAIPVKPVAELWRRWRDIDEKLASPLQQAPLRMAVVGGGAGSVELIAAMAQRGSQRSANAQRVSYTLFCGSSQILAGYNSRARAAAIKALNSYDIAIHTHSRVEKVEPGCLIIAGDDQPQPFDQLFWCTGAAAEPWLAGSGMEVDERGFLAIKNTLQCAEHDNVFAAGDCATQVDYPRPKAGVYAVRQAPVLAQNLRAFLLKQPLKEHIPQRRFLSLLSLGKKRATADRGVLSVSGAWVWRWKDSIDRKFMSRFEDLPLGMQQSIEARLPELPLEEQQMPCGGCGAKIGSDSLTLVLHQLAHQFPAHCQVGDGAQDAAAIPVTGDRPVVQSIDTLRQLVADPWLMGRIAANHALSDLHACGARPISALASIGLPFSAPEVQQRDLYQLLAGALFEFSKVGCQLRGGHSMQGFEQTIGFVVNGEAQSSVDTILRKQDAVIGDELVLTKPLGSGVLFAGLMQQQTDGRDVSAALEMMLQSNAAAGALALKHGATACTDVTGFGLLGHLAEMLGTGLSAQLEVAAIPFLSGALALSEAAVHSTMHAVNQRSGTSVRVADGVGKAAVDLLYDPQTSGGLLICVPQNKSGKLCEALCSAGYSSAAVIGKITDGSDSHHVDLR